MNKFLKIFEFKNAFVFSISLGFIIWLIFYILLPINTSKLSFETIAFIFCSIISFMSGYCIFNFIKTKEYTERSINWFITITVIALVGLTFRYVDLFFIRGIKWNNSFIANKILKSEYASKPSLFITLLGSLRVLYIIPVLILITEKKRSISFWFVALLLIIYGSLEVFLFGTRKPFLILMPLVFVALFYFNRKRLIISKKNILVMASILLLLGAFSYFILDKRLSETKTGKNTFITVVNSRYNDFVKIKDYKLREFEQNPNTLMTKSQVMFIHTGQYVVHGFFELNFIINSAPPKALGLYSFNPIYKLSNRLGLTEKDLDTTDYHPRDYVYTSFFGSLFIDFGWYALALIFLFGVFQHWVFVFAKTHLIAKVFFIILLTVNIAMPIFNLLAGQGLYLFLFLLAIMCYSIKN